MAFDLSEWLPQHKRWCRRFQECLQADRWGQMVEAADGYQELAEQIVQFGSTIEAASWGSESIQRQRSRMGIWIQRFVLVLRSRSEGMSAVGQDAALRCYPSKEDMNLLKTGLERLMSSSFNETFPLDAATFFLSKKEENPHPFRANGNESSMSTGGNLLPPAPLTQGSTQLTIFIEKIGLKDASRYVDPTITVSAVDASGEDIEESQATPIPQKCAEGEKHLVYHCKVHIQTSLETLKKKNACIFFEFKHMKRKKKGAYQSTRCWTFMEADEYAQDGQRALELYVKPTDKKRKRIRLFTRKELYLEVEVQCRSL